MKLKSLPLLCLLFVFFAGMAQDTKKDIKKAKKIVKKADKLLDDEDVPQFNQALPMYLEASKLDTKNPMIQFKIGVCYLNSIQQLKSEAYFLKALELNPAVNKELHYLIGYVKHLNYDFIGALKHYQRYKEQLTPGEMEVKKVLRTISEQIRGHKPYELAIQVEVKNIGKVIAKRKAECEIGKKLFTQPVPAIVTNVSSTLNSPYPDYVPVITADESQMYFTSRNPQTTGGGKDDIDGQFYEDIYLSEHADGKWTKPKNIGKTINTKTHDAAVGLSADGQILYIYKDENAGDLYECKLKGDEWRKPRPMKEINTNAAEKSAAISADGRTLFFTSNRKGGYGGYDIYMCHISEEDPEKWGTPKNLGPSINTEYHEDGVFFHPDGKTLYFSSRGHDNMGGYDIFKTVRQADGSWSKPENLGYPINTTGDDIYFVLSASGLHGYYSSFREDGMGEKDIYMITMPLAMKKKKKPVKPDEPEPEPEPPANPLTLLKGEIYDAVTEEMLGASIQVIDNELNEVLAELSSNEKTGKYLVTLPSGKNYGIAVKKDGYLFHSENFDIPASEDFQEVRKDIGLKRIKVGTKIVLRNIFFDYGKATLRDASVAELNRLIKLLNDVPTLKIEISGHTDSKGSAEFNKTLSANRAKAVVKFIVDKGVSSDRLKAMGYGEERPMAPNQNADGSDNPGGRQLNRRVEFEILEN